MPTKFSPSCDLVLADEVKYFGLDGFDDEWGTLGHLQDGIFCRVFSLVVAEDSSFMFIKIVHENF